MVCGPLRAQVLRGNVGHLSAEFCQGRGERRRGAGKERGRAVGCELTRAGKNANQEEAEHVYDGTYRHESKED